MGIAISEIGSELLWLPQGQRIKNRKLCSAKMMFKCAVELEVKTALGACNLAVPQRGQQWKV